MDDVGGGAEIGFELFSIVSSLVSAILNVLEIDFNVLDTERNKFFKDSVAVGVEVLVAVIVTGKH